MPSNLLFIDYDGFIITNYKIPSGEDRNEAICSLCMCIIDNSIDRCCGP